MRKIILSCLALLVSTSAFARAPKLTGDLCRDTIGIRAVRVLASHLRVPFDIALRSWHGYEPGRAELVNEMDDKEIYDVVIDTGAARYRMSLLRLYACKVSAIWLEKTTEIHPSN